MLVAQEIVHFQEDFFRQGIHDLKPLVLQELAQNPGVHESTVSRVTSHKYTATPRGTFAFKYFFSRGAETQRRRWPLKRLSIISFVL